MQTLISKTPSEKTDGFLEQEISILLLKGV